MAETETMAEQPSSEPPPGKLLGEVIADQAARLGERTFLLFEAERVTFGELHERTNRIANALVDLGVAKGDKVALMLQNTPEFLYVWYATAKMGAVLVPVNTSLIGDGLAYIIDQSDAETLIVGYEYWERIMAVKDLIPKVRTTIVDLRGAPESFRLPPGSSPFSRLLIGLSTPPIIPLVPTDPSEIIYTSGTTGRPKGVVWYQSHQMSGTTMAQMIGIKPDDVLYAFLPLYHGLGQGWVNMGLTLGCAVTMTRKFSASRFWDDVVRYGCTAMTHIGGVIPILCKQPERPGESGVSMRLSFGAGAPKEYWEYFEKRFGLQIVEYYGSTEGGFTTFNPLPAKKGSIGKVVPNLEVRVVDDDDNDVAPGVVGELISRPAGADAWTLTYYKEPEATAEKTQGGWLRTGDSVYYDEESWFYFVDRKRDSMRRLGENITPYDIESAVNSHPAVLESAAVAAPSEMGEDEVKVCVVLKPGASLPPEQLIAYCEEKLARFMIPRYVEFRESLPKTGTEKLQRGLLKKEALGPHVWDRVKAGYTLRSR